MYETINVEAVNPAITRLTLNRPESRNALSWQLIRELKQALQEIDADNSCRVVILTGAGRSFCAGLDLMDQARISGPVSLVSVRR